jgi:hypothetical protein
MYPVVYQAGDAMIFYWHYQAEANRRRTSNLLSTAQSMKEDPQNSVT